MFFLESQLTPGPEFEPEPDPEPSPRKKMDPGIKQVLLIYAALVSMFVVVAGVATYLSWGLMHRQQAIEAEPPTVGEVRLLMPGVYQLDASFVGLAADRNENQYVFRLNKAGADALRAQLKLVNWSQISPNVLATRRGGTLILLYNAKFKPLPNGMVDVLLQGRQTRHTDPLSEFPDRLLEPRVLKAWQNPPAGSSR